MQDRRAPVFMMATANNVTSLPAELLRKGRWDELFAIDLPHPQERYQIFEIHFRKRGRDPSLFEVQSLVEASNGFTGSEIEEAVISAMFAAFEVGREVKTSDVLAAIEATVPLAEMAKEQVDAVREWARTRARSASASPKKEEVAEIGGRKLSKLN